MTNLTNDQKVVLTLNAYTAGGKAAKVDGLPLWTSSNVNVLTLEVAPDGFSATAFGVGAGTATISVAADSDLGAGVTQISTSADFTVTAAPAASLVLTVGTPS